MREAENIPEGYTGIARRANGAFGAYVEGRLRGASASRDKAESIVDQRK